MGVESEDNHKMGEQDSVPPQDHLVQPSAAEQDGKNRAEGRSGAVPTVVVTGAQLADLQQQLAVTQAKLNGAQAKLQHQREKNTEYHQRWRDSHRQHVKDYERERSRRRRAQGEPPPQR